jgi:hypothetical protein
LPAQNQAQNQAGLELTRASALRELAVALSRGNEIVYREALSVYATAATAGATVPAVDCE